MENENKGKAHSTIRRGMTDYNDGANVTDYLGNDDYKNGANLPETDVEEHKLDGKEAGGNLEMEDAELSSPKDKRDGTEEDTKH